MHEHDIKFEECLWYVLICRTSQISCFAEFRILKEKKDINIKVMDKVREMVLEEGYSPSYGARPLRRAITRILEDNLGDKFLSGDVKEGDPLIKTLSLTLNTISQS